MDELTIPLVHPFLWLTWALKVLTVEGTADFQLKNYYYYFSLTKCSSSIDYQLLQFENCCCVRYGDQYDMQQKNVNINKGCRLTENVLGSYIP
jgi:hypothetical protein